MVPQNIVVFGGTSPSSIIFIKNVVRKGHHVTVYVRNPSKLPEDLASNSNVKVIKGDLKDEDASPPPSKGKTL